MSEFNVKDGVRSRPPSGFEESNLPARAESRALHAASPARIIARATATLFLATVIVVGLAVRLAPLAPPATPGTGKYWDVELRTSSPKPVTALIWGKEAGFHLVKVPGPGGPAGKAPARLSDGTVYMMSLGMAPLEVRAIAPPGSPVVEWVAKARMIRTSPDGVGIGW